MSLNVQTLLVLLLQSAVQAWFLTGYFQSSLRGFLVYAGFFLFILYPLDTCIPYEWTIFNIILYFAGLFLLVLVRNRGMSARKLLLAVVLYWLPLPLCEVPIHFMIWAFDLYPLFDPGTISVFGPRQTLTFFLQLAATGILAFLYGLILRKTRAANLNQTFVLYLTSLLASLAALGFLCLCFVYPHGQTTNYLQYPLAVVMLAAFNAWFVISVHRYVRQ